MREIITRGLRQDNRSVAEAAEELVISERLYRGSRVLPEIHEFLVLGYIHA